MPSTPPLTGSSTVSGTPSAVPASSAPASAAPVTPCPISPVGWTPAGDRLTGVSVEPVPGGARVTFTFEPGRTIPTSPAAAIRETHPPFAEGASGLPIDIAGERFVEVRFDGLAIYTEPNGMPYYTGPTDIRPRSGPIRQLVRTDAFEGVVTWVVGFDGLGCVRFAGDPSGLHASVNIEATGPKATGPEASPPDLLVYFTDRNRYAAAVEPFEVMVTRPAIGVTDRPLATLQAFFTGPTATERTRGLDAVTSGFTGVREVRIEDGVARVYLSGACSSGGATYTVANVIGVNLKAFSDILWVKIYDENGQTEQPGGRSDSIPFCLEP